MGIEIHAQLEVKRKLFSGELEVRSNVMAGTDVDTRS